MNLSEIYHIMSRPVLTEDADEGHGTTTKPGTGKTITGVDLVGDDKPPQPAGGGCKC